MTAPEAILAIIALSIVVPMMVMLLGDANKYDE